MNNSKYIIIAFVFAAAGAGLALWLTRDQPRPENLAPETKPIVK